MDFVQSRKEEITRLLDLLRPYQRLNKDEFCRSPKDFGAATRFIQLIAKYITEIYAQNPPLPDQFKQLARFYRESTLSQLKIDDVQEMVVKIDGLIKQL